MITVSHPTSSCVVVEVGGWAVKKVKQGISMTDTQLMLKMGKLCRSQVGWPLPKADRVKQKEQVISFLS